MLEEFCLSCGQHLSDDGRIYCSDECQNLDTVDPPSVSSTSLDTTRLWVEDHFNSSRRGSPSKIASSSGHLWSSQTESPPSARVSREHEQPSGAGLRNRLFDAVCLEDHQSDDPVYLSFRQGEILRVLDCDSRPGWWQASKTVLQDPDSFTNVVGWVPETYMGHLQFFNKWPSGSSDQENNENTNPDSGAESVLRYALDRSIYDPFISRSRRVARSFKKANEVPHTSNNIESSTILCSPLHTYAVALGVHPDEGIQQNDNPVEKQHQTGCYTLPMLFDGSQDFNINGGSFHAVGGNSIHETTNSGNTSFKFDNCIFNYAKDSSKRDSESPPKSATTFREARPQNKSRKRRWSITRFTHIINHVYHHYLPAMYYPMSWMMCYVPWFIPWYQNCAGVS